MDGHDTAGSALDTSLARTSAKYDALPYDDKPIYRTHPARIAAVARLFGLEAADLSQARVLELGCAAGGNIIPLAEFYPGASFVGVDIGGRQIADGQARIARLSLTNIALQHRSITELGPDIGTFDFIICHGVYSWVPAPVRAAILEICGRALTPQGIAYVSYNVLPGWRMFQPLRDAFRLMVPDDGNEAGRVAKARGLLKYMQELSPDRGPYGAILRDAPKSLDDLSDAYLYHEYMEEVNEPVAFTDFIAGAREHGLAYLGECVLSAMFGERFGEEFGEKLSRSTTDIIAYEQMLDILTGNTFRTTLLVRQERQARIDRSISPERLQALHFGGSYLFTLGREDGKVLLVERSGTTRSYDDPVVMRLLERVFCGYPTTFSYAECAEGVAAQDLPDFEAALIALVANSVLEIYAAPLRAAVLGERPRAMRLARMDAKAARRFTATRTHHSVELDNASRLLLPHLDGARDRAALEAMIVDLVNTGKIRFESKAGQRPSSAEVRELARKTVAEGLETIAALGLLEA